MVTLVCVRLFWDGLNVTWCPHGTTHSPLSLPGGHLLHFTSYSTPCSVGSGDFHSNVIEVSVLSINLISLTADGTPMKKESVNAYVFILLLLVATYCIGVPLFITTLYYLFTCSLRLTQTNGNVKGMLNFVLKVRKPRFFVSILYYLLSSFIFTL